jgi:hypothetical protein
MSSWASIAAPEPAKLAAVSKPAATTTPRAFAFAAKANQSQQVATGAFSWAAKVAGKNGTQNPSPTGVDDIDGLAAVASPNFSSASKLTRAAELKQIALDLESSRAGLNLAFTQAVTTSNADTPSATAAAPATAGKRVLPVQPVQPVQPITEAKMAKRQRQIDIGKATTGYKNYAHHVKKKARESKNPRHPKTPKKGGKYQQTPFSRKDSCVAQAAALVG